MTDLLTPEKRSWNIERIKGKDIVIWEYELKKDFEGKMHSVVGEITSDLTYVEP